jgi:hypothetical protein
MVAPSVRGASSRRLELLATQLSAGIEPMATDPHAVTTITSSSSSRSRSSAGQQQRQPSSEPPAPGQEVRDRTVLVGGARFQKCTRSFFSPRLQNSVRLCDCMHVCVGCVGWGGGGEQVGPWPARNVDDGSCGRSEGYPKWGGLVDLYSDRAAQPCGRLAVLLSQLRTVFSVALVH